MDSDFESSNYNLFKTDISVNKFVTTFEFLQEDDEVGSESYESLTPLIILMMHIHLNIELEETKKLISPNFII